MTGDLNVPSWAAGAVVGLIGLLLLYVRWSLKSMHDLAQGRLERIEGSMSQLSSTVHEIDRRVIRIETILNGGDGSTNPAASRIRVLTPPTGIPRL